MRRSTTKSYFRLRCSVLYVQIFYSSISFNFIVPSACVLENVSRKCLPQSEKKVPNLTICDNLSACNDDPMTNTLQHCQTAFKFVNITQKNKKNQIQWNEHDIKNEPPKKCRTFSMLKLIRKPHTHTFIRISRFHYYIIPFYCSYIHFNRVAYFNVTQTKNETYRIERNTTVQEWKEEREEGPRACYLFLKWKLVTQNTFWVILFQADRI